ncbi:alpha/beta fold hydrolase [Amycolatopsis sp. NPDC098790]|uniref:alpha/beta fold hydrolase n=1 Tax=Amycolatopsis sp. NPDC098790 TaxID=3363939 RepID=UPI00380AD729
MKTDFYRSYASYTVCSTVVQEVSVAPRTPVTGSPLSVTIAGTPVEYTVAWTELPLIGDDGAADATISATTYLAHDSSPDRPVTFLFNGGPGASSSPLHMNAFGPRILATEASGERAPVPNPESLLDRTDLVFIDPVGTGFSRTLRDGGEQPYLSVHGDAKAVERFIRHWLAENDRGDSPVYLVGESFGGFRLATLCATIADLPVHGLVFLSTMLDASAMSSTPGNDLPHVFELPAMAVAAWAHGRASLGATTAQAVFDEADEFARDDYLRALYRGSALPDADRDRVAARVAELIGLPVEQVLAADLRVDSEDFLRTLLADRALVTGRLDTRISGPVPTPPPGDRPAAADDPALGIGRANVRHSAELAAYLRDVAGVTTEAPYVSLSLELNFRFDWRPEHPRPAFYTNATVHVGQLLRQRPEARVLVLGGYFDLATPIAGARHAITHAGVPPERVDVVRLACGHSLTGPALHTAATAVRAFLSPRKA